MWVMGGISGSSFKNDVWSSENGVDWTKTIAPWPQRMGHASVVFVDPLDATEKVWINGGEGPSGEFRNDMWSFDGSSWEKRADTSAWSARTHHSAVVFRDPKDTKEKVWISGGISKQGNMNDVWYAPRKY